MKFTIVYLYLVCIIATEGDKICSTSGRINDPTCPTDCSQYDTRVYGETSIFNCTIGGKEYINRYKDFNPKYFLPDTELIFEAPTLLGIQLYIRNKEPALKINFRISQGVESKYSNEIVYPKAILMNFTSIADEKYQDLSYLNCPKQVIFRFHKYKPDSTFDALNPRNISYDCLDGLHVEAEEQQRVYMLILETVQGQSATYIVTANVAVFNLTQSLWQTVIAVHVDENKHTIYVVFQRLLKPHVEGYVVELYNVEGIVENKKLPSMNNSALFTNIKAGEYQVKVSVKSRECPTESTCMTTSSYTIYMPGDTEFGDKALKIVAMVLGCLLGVLLILLLFSCVYCRLYKIKMEPTQGWIIHPFKQGTAEYDVMKKMTKALQDLCQCQVFDFIPEEWNEAIKKGKLEKYCERTLEKHIKFVLVIHSSRNYTVNGDCSYNNFYSYAIRKTLEKNKHDRLRVLILKFSFSQNHLPQILNGNKVFHLMDDFSKVCKEIQDLNPHNKTISEPLLPYNDEKIQALKLAIEKVKAKEREKRSAMNTVDGNENIEVACNTRKHEEKQVAKDTDTELKTPYVRMPSNESNVINDFRIIASQLNNSSASEDESVSETSVSDSKQSLYAIGLTSNDVGPMSHPLGFPLGFGHHAKSDIVMVNDMQKDGCTYHEINGNLNINKDPSDYVKAHDLNENQLTFEKDHVNPGTDKDPSDYGKAHDLNKDQHAYLKHQVNPGTDKDQSDYVKVHDLKEGQCTYVKDHVNPGTNKDPSDYVKAHDFNGDQHTYEKDHVNPHTDKDPSDYVKVHDMNKDQHTYVKDHVNPGTDKDTSYYVKAHDMNKDQHTYVKDHVNPDTDKDPSDYVKVHDMVKDEMHEHISIEENVKSGTYKCDNDYVKVYDMIKDNHTSFGDNVNPQKDNYNNDESTVKLSSPPLRSIQINPRSQNSKTKIVDGYVPHKAMHENIAKPIDRPKHCEHGKQEQDSIHSDEDSMKFAQTPKTKQENQYYTSRQAMNGTNDQDYVKGSDFSRLQTFVCNGEQSDLEYEDRDDSGIDSIQQIIIPDLSQTKEHYNDNVDINIDEDLKHCGSYTDVLLNPKYMTGGRCYRRASDNETRTNKSYIPTNKNQVESSIHQYPSVNAQSYQTGPQDPYILADSQQQYMQAGSQHHYLQTCLKKNSDAHHRDNQFSNISHAHRPMLHKSRITEWSPPEMAELNDNHYSKGLTQNQSKYGYIHHEDMVQPVLEQSVNQNHIHSPYYYHPHEHSMHTAYSEYDKYHTGSKQQHMQQKYLQTGSQQQYQQAGSQQHYMQPSSKQQYQQAGSQQQYMQPGSQQQYQQAGSQQQYIQPESRQQYQQACSQQEHQQAGFLQHYMQPGSQHQYQQASSQQKYLQPDSRQQNIQTGPLHPCLPTESKFNRLLSSDSGHFEMSSNGYVEIPNSSLEYETSFSESDQSCTVPSNNMLRSDAASSGYVTNMDDRQWPEFRQSLERNKLSFSAVDPTMVEQNSSAFDSENHHKQSYVDFKTFDPIPPDSDSSPDGSISDIVDKMEKFN